MKTCCTLFFVCLLIQPALSQKTIQLTNLSSGKKIYLNEGKRIQYILKDGTNFIGVIKEIQPDAITVDEKTIDPTQLKSIGQRKKGSGFLAFAAGFVGTGLIIGAIQSSNDDPCSSCYDAGSSGEGWVAVEIGLGVGIIALGINGAVRNSPRNVLTKWKLEIVEASTVATSG
jgi:hypothetical protein